MMLLCTPLGAPGSWQHRRPQKFLRIATERSAAAGGRLHDRGGGGRDGIQESNGVMLTTRRRRQTSPRYDGPGISGKDTLQRDVMAISRMRLGTALLHARVGYIEQALDKIGGVPARSQLAANDLHVGNLFYRVQVLGRPGGGQHLVQS